CFFCSTRPPSLSLYPLSLHDALPISRSHFWAPVSTAAVVPSGVQLDASKSWVTAAGEADYYIWSSTPVAADGNSTLWLVPGDARSEEHTSESSHEWISYAVFCLKKKI